MALVCIGMVLSGSQAIAREAVECILGQDGIDLEVFLVGSDSDQSFPPSPDSRVRRLTRSRLPTQIQLLELLANESTAPFLLCLYPNQLLLPDALATVLADMRDDESIEMTYTLQFPADESGHISRERYHLQWSRALQLQGFNPTKVEDFLSREFLLDTIRVYRREALCTKVLCGHKGYSAYGFIWSVHCLLKTKLKPEPACISKGTLIVSAPNRLALRDYLRRVTALLHYRAHLQTGFSWSEVVFRAFWYFCLNSPVADAWHRGSEMIRHWQIRSGLSTRCYWLFVRLFGRWPPPEPAAAGTAATNARKRVGYYIWQYPVRSQTFVQREVAALLKAGQDVVVMTEIEPEHDFITELKPLLAGSVIRQEAVTRVTHESLKWKMFRRSPLRYVGLKLFILGTHYHPKKSRRFDKELFRTALRLASLAEKQGVDHLHSPWADNCAFVALIASRLLRIPYSLQARAHDIHRQDYQFALQEKFLNADFVITNTRYNVGQIRAIVGDEHAGKIKLIYNGLNIRQFQPERERRPDGDELRLLCVARLIEQKGLTYLLQACRRLLDSGLKLRLDIVGGFEDIFVNYYIELKRLHQALELESTVHFAGSLPFEAVLAYYQEADIFVLPCVIAQDGSRDIIPNAVLESMAMQLPVISTTVTGLPEMVDDGLSGFLVAPHDVEALVSAIRTLAQSASLRSRFGLAGRKKVERQFDSDINVSRYRELFGNSGKPQLPQGNNDG